MSFKGDEFRVLFFFLNHNDLSYKISDDLSSFLLNEHITYTYARADSEVEAKRLLKRSYNLFITDRYTIQKCESVFAFIRSRSSKKLILSCSRFTNRNNHIKRRYKIVAPNQITRTIAMRIIWSRYFKPQQN